jgi:hypothetical protein
MNSRPLPRLCVRLVETGKLVCVEISNHALEEYRVRAKPTLSRDGAVLDLQSLASFAWLRSNRPDWLRCRQFPAMYLDFGDIVFPADPERQDRSILVALTCLVRGHSYDRELNNQKEKTRNGT